MLENQTTVDYYSSTTEAYAIIFYMKWLNYCQFALLTMKASS